MPAASIFWRKLIDLALTFILLAQLLLDGLELLAQVVVALRLLHLVLHLGLDLGAKLLHFDFLGQVLVQQLQPINNAGGLEQLLLVVRGQEGKGRGNEVHQPAGLFDIGRDRAQLVGECRRFRDDLLELRHHVAHQRLEARNSVAGSTSSSVSTSAIMNGSVCDIAHQAHPAHAFGEHESALVGHAHDFVHRGQCAYSVQVFRLGRSSRGSSCAATTIVRSSPSDSISWIELSRPTVKRQHSMGKQHRIPDRQNRNPAHPGNLFGIVIACDCCGLEG